MNNVYNCEIDGVFPFIYLKNDNGKLIFEKDFIIPNGAIFGSDDFDYQIGVICRKPYKQNYKNNNLDYEFTELGKLIYYNDNDANCYIKQEKNYPRSNPKQISYVYLIVPLRNIKAGEQIIVKHSNYPFEKNIKIASVSPLRQKPDYGCFTTQDKMKQIAKQLYQQSNIISKIVVDLYNMQVKNASKHIKCN